MSRRVLYVSHVCRLGGAERSLLDLIDALEPDRYVAHAVLPGPGELASALEARGVPVETCPHLGRLHRRLEGMAGQALRLLRASLALRRLVRRLRPDVVHANSTTAALHLLALPGRVSAPVVWHVRDYALPPLFGRRLAGASRRVVAPSRACADAVRPVAGDVEIIPNGIRIERAAGDPDRLRREIAPGPGPLAVAIGQLVPWKGHDLVVDALRLARERAPDLTLAIAGSDLFGDDPGTACALGRRIRLRGLGDAVRLLGWRDDVDAILEAADFLVHAAHPEPFGRAVVEAMAAGRPVVAYDGAHGPAEILRDGVDGLLVEERTPEALGDAMARLALDPELRARLGAEGRRRAAECYDRRLMARRVQGVYDEIAAGRA